MSKHNYDLTRTSVQKREGGECEREKEKEGVNERGSRLGVGRTDAVEGIMN